MTKFAGREDELLDQVVRKYIFTVRPIVECRPLVAELLARFEPERLAQMDKLMAEHAGREGEFYRILCEQNLHRLMPADAPLTLGKGELPQPASEAPPELVKAIYRSLIDQAYRRHRPEKLRDVDMLMRKYADYEGDLLDQVMRKYHFSSKIEQEDHVVLFAEFFARFAPSQLPTLSQFLSKNRGVEWKAYRSLCQKYLPCKGATWQKPKRAQLGEKAAAERVAKKPLWNVEEEERRFGGICLDITFQAGSLGLTLTGIYVTEVAEGEQAEEQGIKVGHKLFSLNGQEPPKDLTSEGLDDWAQVWFAGPRPLRAQFIDLRAEDGVDEDEIALKKSPDNDSTEASETCDDIPDTDFEDVWDMDWSAVCSTVEHEVDDEFCAGGDEPAGEFCSDPEREETDETSSPASPASVASDIVTLGDGSDTGGSP